jgi:hypothetical protein
MPPISAKVRYLAFITAALIILWPVSFRPAAARSGIGLYSTGNPSDGETAQPEESVRAELIRLQRQTGLTVASYANGIELVLFDKRDLVPSTLPWSVAVGTSPNRLPGFGSLRGTISRDGTEIAAEHFISGEGLLLEILPSDGSSLREYPNIHPQDLCWSYDKARLAVTAHKESSNPALQLMDLETNATEEIDSRATLTSQCWSPDDKKIVYTSGDSVRVYEVGKDKSSAAVLAIGEYPTWSPDGNWIAFLDHDTYYAIRPNGHGRKKLFHHSDVYSPLWWSPDSRIVAYVTLARFALDDVYQLRVRRLEDRSDDSVAVGQISSTDFQWVTNPKLLQQVESAATTR